MEKFIFYLEKYQEFPSKSNIRDDKTRMKEFNDWTYKVA